MFPEFAWWGIPKKYIFFQCAFSLQIVDVSLEQYISLCLILTLHMQELDNIGITFIDNIFATSIKFMVLPYILNHI